MISTSEFRKEIPKFRYYLRDDAVRGMNRQQYKQASQWLRWSSRFCSASMNWDAVNKHIVDMCVYGSSIISSDALMR